MNRCLRHLLLALLFAAMAVVPAMARVSGYMEWNWADFQSESDEGDVDASHFLQRYSILSSYNGVFNSGRAGGWKAELGYEWVSLKTSINDLDRSVDTGKLLYNGSLIFAPGGLPLRFEAFSYDRAQANTILKNDGRLLSPQIGYDLGSAGQDVVTGFTLLAGIKNGSYLGEYREVLSQIPRILVDYRQTYVRNLDSLEKEHSRLRDLAFVSLNKKDNWFHYRVTEYEDFLDSANNFERRAYVIGTIDHGLTRQWINLTNWVKVSVDGTLEQWQDASGDDEDVYTLNLFAKLQRRDWNLSNFNTFERVVTQSDTGSDMIEKRIDLPVFASGQIDPRTKWRMSLLESSEEELTPGVPVFNEHLFYTTYQLEMLRPSGLVVTPRVALDVKRGSLKDEGQAVKVGLEARTDFRRDLATTWFADYSAAWFNGNANDGVYLEQELSLKMDHQASSRVRVGGRQSLAIGLGEYEAYSTEYLKPIMAGEVNTAAFRDSNIRSRAWRSQSNFYLELTGNSRWKNRFNILFDYLSRDGVSTDNLQLSHVATYGSADFLVNLETFFSSGDNMQEMHLPASELGTYNTLLGEVDRVFAHTATVNFSPLRSFQTGGELALVWGNGDLGSGGIVHLEQDAVYTLLASNGSRRKLMRLEQEFIYEKLLGDSVSDGNTWYAELNLVSWWYPFQFLSLGARGEYRHYGATGANVFEYGLTAQVPFDKLQVAVTYEYGQADDGWQIENNPGVKEHRWEVDIKKTF